MTGKPAYWRYDTARTNNLVDFFIAKGLTKNFTNVEGSLDHLPVILSISESLMKKEGAPRLTSNKTKWDGFRNDCEENIVLIVSLKTPDEIEDEVGRSIEVL